MQSQEFAIKLYLILLVKWFLCVCKSVCVVMNLQMSAPPIPAADPPVCNSANDSKFN